MYQDESSDQKSVFGSWPIRHPRPMSPPIGYRVSLPTGRMVVTAVHVMLQIRNHECYGWQLRIVMRGAGEWHIAAGRFSSMTITICLG